MLGPVRSMSRTPTECPASDNENASCAVTEDLPTPPFPERTYKQNQRTSSINEEWGDDTRMICFTLSRDMINRNWYDSVSYTEVYFTYVRVK